MKKRLTALILAAVTVLGIMPAPAFSQSDVPVYDAAGDIKSFIEYFNDAREDAETGTSLFSLFSNDEVPDDNPYNRLVLYSDADLDYSGALYAVTGYDGLQIIQYDSDEEYRAAYERFKNSDDVDAVSIDINVELFDGESEEETPVPTASGAGEAFAESSAASETDVSPASDTVTGAVPTSTPLSWGYGEDYMDTQGYQKAYLEGEELEQVIVAVIDSGANINHELLKDRIINQYNVTTGTSTASDMADKEQKHGTHVCGIVADGTLSNVKIMPVKIADSSGNMSSASLITALEYAIEYDADVINMSLGTAGLYGDDNSSLTTAVEKATAAGITVAAASGNDAVDTRNMSPANIPDVIAVSAMGSSTSGITKASSSLAYYSNYGFEIDIAAAGSYVYSSYYSSTSNSYYYKNTGTSMACPHIAACIANILSYDTSITREKAELLLKSNASRFEYSATKYRGDMARLSEDFIFDGVLIDGAHYAETAEGGTIALTADTYTDGVEITWTSSDKSVATVDEDGNVTGVSAGTATITASAQSEITSSGTVTDTCEIAVLDIDDWYSAGEMAYEIDSAAELLDVAELVSSGTDDFSGKTVTLTDDIDLSGIDWIPIGYDLYLYDDYTPSLAGTFDGGNHTVSNLENTCVYDYTGLFTRIAENGTVKNVWLSDAAVTGEYSSGGICGYNEGTIMSCYISGSVYVEKYLDVWAGGICAYNSGTIINCSDYTKVSAVCISYNVSYIGGITGQNDKTVKNCIAAGDVAYSAYTTPSNKSASGYSVTIGAAVGRNKKNDFEYILEQRFIGYDACRNDILHCVGEQHIRIYGYDIDNIGYRRELQRYRPYRHA